MNRSLTPASSLDNIRKEAKRWLKALRAGDAAARRRLVAANPAAPDNPGLRDVQLALAREHGLAGWAALRQALEDLALQNCSRAERIEAVLRSATWRGDRTTASRFLVRWPELATAGLLAAVSTGKLAEVERCLATDPGAAARKAGPLDREPLLYLAYARLPGGEGHGTDIARLLLDRGADPNARWRFKPDHIPFTALTGVIGEGEGMQPPHPQAEALADLLIERGADPYDPQALYNTSIVGDEVFWLEFLWTRSEQCGRLEAWRTTEDTAQIGGVVTLSALDYLLGNAVSANHLKRAGWLLAHGADPDSPQAYAPKRSQREAALALGYEEMAELLVHHGAAAPPLRGEVAFQAACMRLDREAAREVARAHPEVLASAQPMIVACRAGRMPVVALLLELGVPVDVADQDGLRGLQAAIMGDSLEVVELLVAHGADVDRPTKHFGGAMGFAGHFGRRTIAAFLAPRSQDVHNLTHLGMKDRLAELFAADPTLVNFRHPRHLFTPLFVVPPDEQDAVDMAAFLLACGADPQMKNASGESVEESYRRRGLFDLVDLLHAEAS